MPPRFDINNIPENEEDIDFSDIEERYQLSFEEGFDNIVVVDNIPLVDETKEEKLIQFLRKIFKNVGEIRDKHFTMPKAVNEKGKLMSKGYASAFYFFTLLVQQDWILDATGLDIF
jgi:translation initiation factor 3 subunit B